MRSADCLIAIGRASRSALAQCRDAAGSDSKIVVCDRESWSTYFRISLPDRREYGEVDSLHVESKFLCGGQKEKTDVQHPSSDWTSSAFEGLNGEK